MDPRLVVALFDLPRDADISALVLQFPQVVLHQQWQPPLMLEEFQTAKDGGGVAALGASITIKEPVTEPEVGGSVLPPKPQDVGVDEMADVVDDWDKHGS
ncbi:hypothetical protein HAX54_024331 [Datura stramonium]|uniref:NFXL1 RRM-like domain-containing protein n=1 Tax=Datura stramonium TaxID=4076 RepID=A0ABS8S5Z9_DATST|nr:hypothetical protein [Datura stramonium]